MVIIQHGANMQMRLIRTLHESTPINSDNVMPTAPVKPTAPTLQKFTPVANVPVPAIHPVKQASVTYHLDTIDQIQPIN